MQVSEKDRDNARSAVVSAYHALDCVSIPVAFLHAFADAAVGALSTDAEPVAFAVKHDLENGGGAFCSELNGVVQDHLGHWQNADVPLYPEPVKTAPAVAVKALEWRDEPVPPSGETLAPSVAGLYCIPHSGDRFYLRFRDAITLGDYSTLDKAKAAAQADYETRIRSALSAQVQDVAEAGDLNKKALSLAAQAYERKLQDMSGPCPTEEPQAGGGPIGYAIRAYLSAASPASKHRDAE